MTRSGAGVLVIVLAGAVPLLAAALAYPDAPPLGTTGGFGEPTCAVCHVPPRTPDPPATIVVRGVPSTFTAGCEHELTIELGAPGLARAGFELAARFADGPDAGRQAGTLAAVGPETTVSDSNGVQYAHHTGAGTAARDGLARWTLRWTAPQESSAVVFHVAANAANGDDSALGDRVLLFEARASPRSDP